MWRLVRWVFRQEIGVLIAAALVAIAVWLFANVADEVLEGEADPIDRRILTFLREPDDPAEPIGPAWLEVAAEEITALGSGTVLTLLTAGVCGLLWLRGSGRSALFVLVAVAGGTLLSSGLKAAFSRPRPDIVPHLTHFGEASFPSGHAMLSTVAYLTLGALMAAIEQRRRVRAYIIAMAVLTAALVGATRVYLGVHYPTDVAAGWALGVAWAVGCWGVARWWRLRAKSRVDEARKDLAEGDAPGEAGPEERDPVEPHKEHKEEDQE
jgi:undecaprenyl-diphosphatase